MNTVDSRSSRATHRRQLTEATSVGVVGGGTAGSVAAAKSTVIAASAMKTTGAVGIGKGLVAGLGMGAVAVSPIGVGLVVGAMAGLLYASNSFRPRRRVHVE